MSYGAFAQEVASNATDPYLFQKNNDDFYFYNWWSNYSRCGFDFTSVVREYEQRYR